MLIAKWGNSLAVRIPADVVKALDLKAGDEVAVRRADDGALEVAKDRRREEALARIRALARPLPAGYKFDREEANSRGPDAARY